MSTMKTTKKSTWRC